MESTFYILSHLFITTLQSQYYCSYFTGEETKAHKGLETFPANIARMCHRHCQLPPSAIKANHGILHFFNIHRLRHTHISSKSHPTSLFNQAQPASKNWLVRLRSGKRPKSRRHQYMKWIAHIKASRCWLFCSLIFLVPMSTPTMPKPLLYCMKRKMQSRPAFTIYRLRSSCYSRMLWKKYDQVFFLSSFYLLQIALLYVPFHRKEPTTFGPGWPWELGGLVCLEEIQLSL